jgi:hypothetical protein
MVVTNVVTVKICDLERILTTIDLREVPMVAVSASVVRACITAFVEFEGREIRIGLGDKYESGSPLVTAFPMLFALAGTESPSTLTSGREPSSDAALDAPVRTSERRRRRS